MRTLTIRAATAADADVLAALLGHLGYPCTARETAERLASLEAFGAIARVAELEGRVVGLITAQVQPSIHTPSPVAWLTTLVVDEAHAGTGVGRALTEHVEAWGARQGALRIAVTSAAHRQGAHAFYERLGYAKTGVRLVKPLQPGGG